MAYDIIWCVKHVRFVSNVSINKTKAMLLLSGCSYFEMIKRSTKNNFLNLLWNLAYVVCSFKCMLTKIDSIELYVNVCASNFKRCFVLHFVFCIGLRMTVL